MADTGKTQARTSHRKEREGEVVSTKMDKTIVVRIARRISHPLYKKIITRYKSFNAHDERNEAQVGDLVRISETRPLSKTCLLYTSPSPRDLSTSRMPSSA